MLLLLPLQMMVTLAVLVVLAMVPIMVIFVVVFVVVSVVVSIFLCVVSLEAFVALLHQLQEETLDHVELEDWMAVVEGWHGTKFFLLPERSARTISSLVAIAVQVHGPLLLCKRKMFIPSF